ncbi:uncharacterized protein [Procambarus clarkii]|uniref:uncharacterized protein n=1 Tax=Procambarus clarkii TaxID=6728 RepID=UPI0037424DFF
MELAPQFMTLLVSLFALRAFHLTVAREKAFMLHVSIPPKCHYISASEIPGGMLSKRKDLFCVMRCAPQPWCMYVYQNGTHCFLYDQSSRPSINGTGVQGFRYPPGPWQPPPVVTTFTGICVNVYAYTLAPGHRAWSYLVAETHRVNFTDCPCIGNASFNLASIILDDAHNITSVSVTTSYGNQSTLLKNATIHVGLTMTKSDPIVANLSNTPSSFTKQTFNVTAYGKHVTLIRWDNIPLCVCYLGAKGY